MFKELFRARFLDAMCRILGCCSNVTDLDARAGFIEYTYISLRYVDDDAGMLDAQPTESLKVKLSQSRGFTGKWAGNLKHLLVG
jgi:hypothetical protein